MFHTCAGGCKASKLQQLVTQKKKFVRPFFLATIKTLTHLTIKRDSASLCLIVLGIYRLLFDF